MICREPQHQILCEQCEFGRIALINSSAIDNSESPSSTTNERKSLSAGSFDTLKRMLFVVIFTDQPGKGDVRDRHLEPHLEWLETHRDLILIGGSLRQELGEVPTGGMWIAEALSKNQLEELIKTDPFYLSGLRQSCKILRWAKANIDRKVLL